MKNWFWAVAAGVAMLAGAGMAQAGDHRHSQGHSHHRPLPSRGHYDYQPGHYDRHRGHYDYVPGHFDYHRGRHYDYSRRDYIPPSHQRYEPGYSQGRRYSPR